MERNTIIWILGIVLTFLLSIVVLTKILNVSWWFFSVTLIILVICLIFVFLIMSFRGEVSAGSLAKVDFVKLETAREILYRLYGSKYNLNEDFLLSSLNFEPVEINAVESEGKSKDVQPKIISTRTVIWYGMAYNKEDRQKWYLLGMDKKDADNHDCIPIPKRDVDIEEVKRLLKGLNIYKREQQVEMIEAKRVDQLGQVETVMTNRVTDLPKGFQPSKKPETEL